MTGINNRLERRIAEQLVRDAIAKGYCVTVQDMEEGETCVLDGTVAGDVLAVMGQTDGDVLRFRDRLTGGHIGWVLLIYGNGTDLISDSSANDATDALLLGAETLAEKLSADLDQ